MLNLLCYREQAQYAPADPEAGEPPVSGAEAYERYSNEAGPVFAAVGGAQFWIATPNAVLIGPDSERWDHVFIARYPTPHAFVDMIKNPDYNRATRHRTAAVADSRLIACGTLPIGETFLPGPTT